MMSSHLVLMMLQFLICYALVSTNIVCPILCVVIINAFGILPFLSYYIDKKKNKNISLCLIYFLPFFNVSILTSIFFLGEKNIFLLEGNISGIFQMVPSEITIGSFILAFFITTMNILIIFIYQILNRYSTFF